MTVLTRFRDALTGRFTRSRDPATTVGETARRSRDHAELRKALTAARYEGTDTNAYIILANAIEKVLSR